MKMTWFDVWLRVLYCICLLPTAAIYGVVMWQSRIWQSAYADTDDVFAAGILLLIAYRIFKVARGRPALGRGHYRSWGTLAARIVAVIFLHLAVVAMGLGVAFLIAFGLDGAQFFGELMALPALGILAVLSFELSCFLERSLPFKRKRTPESSPIPPEH